jgi:mRNA interferase HigB
MRVNSQKALRDFASTYPDADAPLRAWHKTVKTGTYLNLVELRRTFASVDYVPVGKREFYVFNVGGNKYRLVASIHFNRQRLFVRFIITHREYARGDWKK